MLDDKDGRRARLAIDGPAASGKSAVGSAVARALDLPFIDTGGIYRALTWLALSRGVDPADAGALTELAASAHIAIGPTPAAGETETVSIDGLDATPHLRDEAVDKTVSIVSAVPGVRAALVRLQQDLADDGAVMAGRDIGSVVLPDAQLKVYLDASPEERARRRRDQLEAQGEPADYDALVEQMRQRDHLDSTREVAPLRIPAGAVHLVTDGMTLEEVVQRVLEDWARRRPAEHGLATGADGPRTDQAPS